MDRTCQTCKHWDTSLKWFDGNMGFCARLSNGVIAIEGDDQHPYAVDTPPDFGCVLWSGDLTPNGELLEPYEWGPDGPPKGEPFKMPE